MNREIFIDTLRRALYGKVDDYTLADHLRYYENYISQEIARGRSEQEVLDELGDPRLIARTILEAAEAKASYREYAVIDEDSNGQRVEEEQIRVHQYQGWKATLIMAAVFLVILLVLIVAFHILVAVLPFLIVAGVLVWLAKKLWS